MNEGAAKLANLLLSLIFGVFYIIGGITLLLPGYQYFGTIALATLLIVSGLYGRPIPEVM